MAQTDEHVIIPMKFRRGVDLGVSPPVAAQSIEDMPVPKKLYVPLKQHLGASCEHKVSPGDKVKIGQILGESTDPTAAPVHAPVSGEVVSVADHLDACGDLVPTVTIANDMADEWLEEPGESRDFLQKKISDMIRDVRMSGLVEALAGRPVSSMLAPPERSKSFVFLVGIPVLKPVELLIVNTLDREPTMAANRRLLQERSSDLKIGIELVKKIIGVKKVVMAVSEDLVESSHSVREAVSEGVKVVPIKNRYPVARADLLTTAVTGREVPVPGGEPRDVGVLVLETESILGILDAVRSGRPQIDRIVTVVGPELTPRNLRVRVGTSLKDLITFAGGAFDQASKVVVGGLMDGAAQFSENVPVTKQTSVVHVIDEGNLVTFSEQLCIKCGRCVAVCPMRLLPNVITNFCEFGYFQEAEGAELFKCIECGCCAYVCPAKRPLVHYVKHGKSEVMAMRASR